MKARNNPNTKTELPISCASCSHFSVCFIRRDVVDIISSAPVYFAENDQNHKGLFHEIYVAFAGKCNQYKKGK